jgi:peptidoglycan/xylan/chitin deacetylase (PgdA/CDA1 family)
VIILANIDIGPMSVALGRRLLPGCLWAGDGARPEVALSFDDGPDPEHTPRLLDVLDRLDAPGTFFWLGDRLDGARPVIERVGPSRHQVGLHGVRHRSFLLRGSRSLCAELSHLRDDVARRTGRDPERVAAVRPPFGHIRPAQARALGASGFRVVLCSILPGDWAAPSAVVVRRVRTLACAGSLIALHDGGPGGRAVADSVAELVPWLRDRGLRLVTVDQLGAPSGPGLK